jgi:hypothetical protein
MLRRACFVFGLMLVGLLGSALSQAADAPAEATVTDAENKEVKVTGLKFSTGTHRLAWLADPNAATEDAKKGPLVLEVREPHSTSYAKGIVTYVPVASIESIKYDYEKQFASISVKGITDPVTGTLQYKNINVLGFSGTADGKATTFSGGAFAKGNIKAVAFPDAKPLPARKGVSAWQIQIDQPKAMNPTLKVGELKFLYQFAGSGEVLVDAVTVHKSDPLKFDAAVKSYTTLAVDPNSHVVAAEVQVGDAERVVVIMPTIEKDGKTGTLVGVVGEVEAGWKMFPLHTIKNMKRPKKD